MKRILIMGLPGAGKTTLAARLTATLFFESQITWINADAVREKFNDWDFSHEGRIRQAHRMRELADKENNDGKIAVCDFIAPLQQMRDIFDADYVIWMDTIQQSKFQDTNRVFEPPQAYNLRIINFNYNVDDIARMIQ